MLPPDPKKSAADRALAKAEPVPPVVLPAALPVPWMAGAEASALPPGLSSAPSLAALLQAFRRRWQAILGVALAAGVLAAVAVWLALPGKFHAQTALELTSRTDAGYESEADLLSYRRAQLALLKSPEVLLDALQKPEVVQLGEVRAHADNPVAWLQQALQSDDKEGNNVLILRLSGESPEDLPVILNAVVRSFLGKKQREVKEKIKKLQENRSVFARELDLKRKRLDQEAKNHGLDNPLTLQARHEDAQQDLRERKKHRAEMESKLKSVEAALKSIQERVDHPEKLRISELAVEDEVKKEETFKELYKQLVQLELLILNAEALGGKGAAQQETSARDAVLELIATKKKELRPAIEVRLRSKQVNDLREKAIALESELAGIRAGNKKLDADIEAMAARVEKLRASVLTPGKLPSVLEPFNDQVLQTEGVLKKIDEKLSALQAENPASQAASATPEVAQVKVIYPAETPRARDSSRQAKMAGMAGLGMFGLAFVGFVLVESRKRRVTTADDIVQGLGINLVGTVPALPARARRPVVGAPEAGDQVWHNIMIESVDVIRTVLLHASRAEALRVVMVTSAESGEGKTSLASHLAASLSRAWRKTLLIDGDLRNPAAHVLFQVPQEPGFSELLRGEVGVDDVVRPTPVSRLWMLPAGRWDSHAIQALAQEEVRTFFDHLKKEFDFIVIDACPVLPVADSLLLGQHVDAVLFSVMRHVSRTPAVYAAQQRLAGLGVRTLGAVVIGEGTETYGSASRRYLTCNPG
jgi:capsular exopolysaccharide synthesis family protein